MKKTILQLLQVNEPLLVVFRDENPVSKKAQPVVCLALVQNSQGDTTVEAMIIDDHQIQLASIRPDYFGIVFADRDKNF